VEKGGRGRSAAVVGGARAAHLVALEAGSRDARGAVRGAEHADLLVEVSEVRDLELLGLPFEGREAVRAEEAARDVERMAGVALLRVDRRVEVEVLARRLRARERVV